MIEMKNIDLSFDQKVLFKKQNIRINSSKITVITGESGSGKSTLLFELSTLTHYSSNDYYTDIDRESFRKRIAFVFQDCRLFNDLSVIQNIELFTKLAEVEFDKDKMMTLLDELDLSIDLNGDVKVLSGGQKQRLLILCCMMKDPDVIFLDEPTAYLDSENRKHMRQIIYDLSHKYHKTIVIATHDMDMLEIADKHYHIENQKIVLKKDSYVETKKSSRKNIHTSPIDYYLKAERHNKIHYRRNIVIMILMIAVTYMMCYQGYYQIESEKMINNAIDNELRISYKDGGNAYDMSGKPISRTLIQDISSNSMVNDVYPFFQWNVLNTPEKVVIQPYYKSLKTYKKYPKHSFIINNNKLNTDSIYISYSLYQKLNKNIQLTGMIQIPISSDYKFTNISFKLSNANVVDQNINNRYTKSTENIIYISQDLYQKILNLYTVNNTYESNVYVVKVNSYKNIQTVIDFIKEHDSEIKVYNPVSSAVLNQTTTFGYEMIQQFSQIIFLLFIISCLIIGVFDVVSRRYQYALLLVNGIKKIQCIGLIFKERLHYCIMSIIVSLTSVLLIFYFQYHMLLHIIIEKAIYILCLINLIILIIPCLTFYILMKLNNEGNMLKTSEE